MPMGADQGRSCAINWIKAYVPTSVGEEAFCGKDRRVSPGKLNRFWEVSQPRGGVCLLRGDALPTAGVINRLAKGLGQVSR